MRRKLNNSGSQPAGCYRELHLQSKSEKCMIFLNAANLWDFADFDVWVCFCPSKRQRRWFVPPVEPGAT
jgi:hypothetical protein